ncbi:MAG TPA: RNA 2',3'-cyclic phosphodiesterase [Firmicutes bacterium]|nr:RNA 2',3'-cyclic phosphodiesterase [Bacillota bacterium]
MRSFLAIQLSEEIRARITDFIKSLPRTRGVKLVPAENLHITLEFLGEIDGKKQHEISLEMRRIAETVESFPLRIKGTGAFPKKHTPRVLWLGMDRQPALMALAEQVKTSVAVGDGKPFSPHLTVGRVKFEDLDLEIFLKQFFAEPSIMMGEMEVTSFSLMKSDLSYGTPIYTELERFSFTAGNK